MDLNSVLIIGFIVIDLLLLYLCYKEIKKIINDLRSLVKKINQIRSNKKTT